eukprot:9131896-Prorocentrum_lima.AAC.1
MTSSLVGSEMCIRDRASLLVGKVQSVCGQSPKQHSSMRWATCAVFFAVSYTHLTLPTICSV